MTGIIIVDKPAGWTSQDVAAKLRGVFHERRVGHGGTLDPMATGVLPVFLGRATRAVPFFESAEKTYEATLQLGLVTDTQDTTGAVLERHAVCVTREALQRALLPMLGPQMQVPPMYSAVKIGGKKLYELARSGKEIERPARPIVLYELTLLDFSGTQARIRVRCSKGTYVRTLCHDLGRVLGCGGCLASLRRTQAGRFTLQEACTMEEILDGRARILPVDALFSDCPAVTLSDAQALRCRNGNPVPLALPQGRWRVYDPDGSFLMLGRSDGAQLWTVKSFFEVAHG